MNVLIIGEFSGFAYNLKKGFEILGHHVVVVQNGDGFKSIPSSQDDIYYKIYCWRLFGRIIPLSVRLLNWKVTRDIKRGILDKGIDFDIIIIICDKFISKSWLTGGFPFSLLKRYKKNGTKIILTSCGGDAAYCRYVKELPYYKLAYPKGLKTPSRHAIKKLKDIISLSSCIVPTAYDYDYTIRRFIEKEGVKIEKIQYIQLPVEYEDIKFSNHNNIIVFHGLNRPIRKGTPFIKEAFVRIKEKYGDMVDVVIDGKMPFEKYRRLMDDVDIIVDQTNSFGTGINAEMGLMKGKVVLGGNSKEERELRGIDSPIINIEPDPNMIFNILESLILDRNKLDELKEKSRIYALSFLRSDIIAQRYIEVAFPEIKR